MTKVSKPANLEKDIFTLVTQSVLMLLRTKALVVVFAADSIALFFISKGFCVESLKHKSLIELFYLDSRYAAGLAFLT